MMRMIFELRGDKVGSTYLRAKGQRYRREDTRKAITDHFKTRYGA
jgi:hypothetical protein